MSTRQRLKAYAASSGDDPGMKTTTAVSSPRAVFGRPRGT
jgi:hypothetical protein